MACPSTPCDIAKYPDYCQYNPFGPSANCTLDVCCPEYSVYAYIPGMPANFIFLVAFSGAMAVHIHAGWLYKQWWFVGCMVAGCLDEVFGYVGRVIMARDLWNFNAFMVQVVCITTAPVFFCAAIYVLVAKTISAHGQNFLRFNPMLYWMFIPCDIFSLGLQAAGGAVSSVSSGRNNLGVDLALAGLALQVITLVIFCVLYGDHLWRYLKSEQFRERAGRHQSFGRKLRFFYTFQSLAVVAILMRCVFRLLPTILAAVFLLVGHPGLIFGSGNSWRSPMASSAKEHELKERERQERKSDGSAE
ncbi:hypothetical protein KVR01_008537 [Diaporthe batatas]|uniref:uncharacterized protein n=1 Tax=Diaporthe batatas TaxID=748121 RepID=UPI001D04A896|nr:uncharacterized protein KVR01_008537 [Diaporthe batatas]KAG8161550.1 hypothetical protein KVR01_008537 [Diaporthe batatas]